MTMKHLNVLIPPELLAQLNDLATEYDFNRSQVARLAIWRLLNPPEPYVAPTLPDWQAESWTLLLRSLFGDKRLVLTAKVKALLQQAVAALNEREAQVLRLRFGLRGRQYTLTEVGVMQGVNRQRAHQVEQGALRRMRRWLKDRGIWELLEGQLNEKET